MDWCSVYLTPQSLPKYIYLSPPLIFSTTYNGIRTKNRPVWITLGAAPIRWMRPIRNPRWEQKRTEGYVIVSNIFHASVNEYTSSCGSNAANCAPLKSTSSCPCRSKGCYCPQYQHKYSINTNKQQVLKLYNKHSRNSIFVKNKIIKKWTNKLFFIN
jgi:hypothetical protein